MDKNEQETLKEDPEIEVTDLHTHEEDHYLAEHSSPVGAGSDPIWLNWRFVMVGGILLLLIAAILPILPAIRSQLNQHNSSGSAPGLTRAALTPTPIIPSSWDAGTVSPTIVNGVAYIGAAGGAVSAVRLSDGSLLWQYKTQGDTSAAPLVVNGVVYAAANVNNGPGSIYALRASNGALLWSYKTGSYVFIPALVNDVAYIASEDKTVSALQAGNGRLLWRHRLKDRAFGTPVVDNGLVFVTSDKNMLYALRAGDGAQLWQYPNDSGLPLALDGVVYTGSGQTLVALKSGTGAVLWHTSLDGYPMYRPVVSNGIMYLAVTKITEETAFVPSHSGGYELREAVPSAKKIPVKKASSSICALRSGDGSILWCYKGDNTNGWATQIVLSDEKIFAATIFDTSQGSVYALQADNGSLLWSYSGQDKPDTLTVGNDAVYLGSDDVLFALRINDGSLLWRYAILGSVAGDPVVDGASVYAGADNGITYALQADTGALRWYYLTKIGS